MTDPEKQTDRRLHFSFLLFTIFFVAAMFLPRVVTKGMFGDGLLYASMARNLAEGNGSWWAPFFSNGYWTDVVKPAYYENPPLMLWIQSVFFRVLGDHWWVEKGYSFLLLLFNCFLIFRIWQIPFGVADQRRQLAWMPVFFFYLFPSVIWGSPNNLMDSTMLAFCLLAVFCVGNALFRERGAGWYSLLAVLFIFLGLLTKGPVALYPLAVPFLFALTVRPEQRMRGFGYSLFLGGIVLLMFTGLLAAFPEARHFFQNYREQRLSIALTGGREDGVNTGWKRLSIFMILGQELLPVVIATILLWGAARWKKWPVSVERNDRLLALFYTLAGCCATLPLLASTRQAGMYLISGLPMFALAAGYFNAPLVLRLFSLPAAVKEKIAKRLTIFSLAALLVALMYTGIRAGKPGREPALQRDIAEIQKIMPAGETIAVCEVVMRDFMIHTYLQRFHHIELSRDQQNTRFFATDVRCDPAAQPGLAGSGFSRIVFKGEVLTVYGR